MAEMEKTKDPNLQDILKAIYSCEPIADNTVEEEKIEHEESK